MTFIFDLNKFLENKWTYEDFSADAIRYQQLKPGEDDGFVVFSGFIDIYWTFATLFQILTLDQWSETFDKIQRGQLEHIYDNQTSFCDLHSFRSLTGYKERYASEQYDWGMSEITSYIFAIALPLMWLWLANVTFKNLITGIIVNSFLEDSNEKRYDQTEEIIENEVKELEKELAGESQYDRVPISMMEAIGSAESMKTSQSGKTDIELQEWGQNST